MAQQTIPTFSLARQVANDRTTLLAAIQQVLDSQQFIGGSFVQEFEKQLATYLNAKHVIACNSGTDALLMAVRALQVPENAIVLTTPFSFIASSSEIVSNKAHPVFIDIDPRTYNIDPNLVEQWLTHNATLKDGKLVHKITNYPIVGMLPVDIFGQCADYKALHSIAQTWGLWIVEDCAQALGATIDGKKAGTFGTIGTLSFYPTKNLGAFGDGGACITDDEELAEKLIRIRNHGRKSNYEYEGHGINSRLDALQAAILSTKLPKLDACNRRRQEIAQRYNKELAGIPFIKTPQTTVGSNIFHQYTVLVEDENGTALRNELEKYLAERSVQTRIFYPQPLPSIPFLRTHPALVTACPIADYACQRVLSLPMWPELEDGEITHVIQTIKSMPYTMAPITKRGECNRATLL